MRNIRIISIRLLSFSLVLTSLSCIEGFSQQTMFGNEEIKQPGLPEINPEKNELKSFVEVYEQLIELEAQHNLRIMQIIKDHNMEISRFETINAAQRLNMEIDTEIGEMNTYQAIKEEINKNKTKTIEKMEKVLHDHNFTRRRYGLILMKLKQDNTFREQIDSLRIDGLNNNK